MNSEELIDFRKCCSPLASVLACLERLGKQLHLGGHMHDILERLQIQARDTNREPGIRLTQFSFSCCTCCTASRILSMAISILASLLNRPTPILIAS